LKKQLSDTDKELHEKIEKLKDRESQIFRKDTEISDLKANRDYGRKKARKTKTHYQLESISIG
jgi:cell division protein FtsB